MKTGTHLLKRSFALFLVLLLSVSLFQVSALAESAEGGPSAAQTAAAEGKDLTAAVKGFTLSVTQNGTEIADGGTLDTGAELAVRCTFNLPLTDDNGNRSVSTGDYATLAFPSWLVFAADTTVSMMAGSVQVGTVTFSGSTAKVVFDLSQVDEDATEISSAWFSASMKFSSSEIGESGKDQSLTILGKTYSFRLEHVIHYSLEKSGVLNDAKNAIEWTIKVGAKYSDQTSAPSLAGCTVTDNLSSVGDYEADSLSVNGAAAVPSLDAEHVLTYTFPDDFADSSATLVFKTAFDKNSSAILTAGSAEVANTAALEKDGSEKASGSCTVDYTPTWITKSGVQVTASTDKSGVTTYTDVASDTVSGSPYYKWTIVANPDGCSLKGLTVTDALPGGLSFVSAWYTLGSGAATTITPTQNVYRFEDVSAPVTLTIISKISSNYYCYWDASGVAYPKNSIGFTNTASVQWEGSKSYSGKSGSMTYGWAPISKKAESYDTAAHTAAWTVTVNTHTLSYGGDLSVLDLIVNGNSFDKKNVTAVSDGTGAVTGDTLTALTQKVSSLTIADNMKNMTYAADSFTAGNTSGLTVKVYKLTDKNGGTADLLAVSGLSTAAENSFSFKTLLTDPAVYAVNQATIQNTASFFSGASLISSATAGKKISWMLAKDVLSVENGAKLESGATGLGTVQYAGNDSDCFNYATHAAYFRILVNADGMNYADVNTTGNFTFTDTLPAGWHFAKIGTGDAAADFLLYQGGDSASSNSQVYIALANQVSAADAGCTMTASPVSEGAAGQETMTFTFAKLQHPYMVVVKAVMDQTTFEGLFSSVSGGAVSYNTKNYVSCGDGKDLNAAPFDWEDVKLAPSALTKEMGTPASGAITWTVDYHSYGIDHTATDKQTAQLTDTIPSGIELRTDSQGTPLLGGSVTLQRLSMDLHGNYQTDASWTISDEELAKLLTYNSTDRTLTVRLPAGSDSYRLTYVTDITGDAGTNITNTVTLETSRQHASEVKKQYQITTADAGAELKFGGAVTISKSGANGAMLCGAEFTLTNGTITRRGATDAKGILKLKAIPAGTYTLSETTAPSGYSVNPHSYTVVVNEDRSVTIDGVSGNAVQVYDTLTDSASLKLTKTVSGNAATAADRTTAFQFTVTLPGEQGTVYTYVGSGVDGGTLTAGENTVALASGQSITILNLPAGGVYTVAEKDYSASGFVTTSTGASGTLAAGVTAAAAFVNAKTTTSGSDGGDDGNNDGGGTTDIQNPDTPLAPSAPDSTDTQTPSATTEETEIPDTQTPLASAPKTGDQLAMWLAVSGASALSLAWLILSSRKRKGGDETHG